MITLDDLPNGAERRIDTLRLVLRPPEAGDAEALYKLLHHETLAQHKITRPPTVENLREDLHAAWTFGEHDSLVLRFVGVGREGMEIEGQCTLVATLLIREEADALPAQKAIGRVMTAELTMYGNPDYAGNHYGLEALESLDDFSRGLGCTRRVARIEPQNGHIAEMAKGAGMQLVMRALPGDPNAFDLWWGAYD